MKTSGFIRRWVFSVNHCYHLVLNRNCQSSQDFLVEIKCTQKYKIFHVCFTLNISAKKRMIGDKSKLFNNRNKLINNFQICIKTEKQQDNRLFIYMSMAKIMYQFLPRQKPLHGRLDRPHSLFIKRRDQRSFVGVSQFPKSLHDKHMELFQMTRDSRSRSPLKSNVMK